MYYSSGVSVRVNGVLSPAMNATRRCLQGHRVGELSPEEQATPHYCQHTADTPHSHTPNATNVSVPYMEGARRSRSPRVPFKDARILDVCR